MIEIISGTNRPNSNSLKVAKVVLDMYLAAGVAADLIDLSTLKFQDVLDGEYYKDTPASLKDAVRRVTEADGLVMVVAEYNGSFPGILKLFIDYWKYPQTFEARPVACIGLGGRWGGLRPVEHLQQVMSYRSAYLFPQRLFLANVGNVLKDGTIADPVMLDLLKTQVRDFPKFIEGLKSQGLDANSKLKVAAKSK